MDLFTTSKNKQLPLYVSPIPDGQACTGEALSIGLEQPVCVCLPSHSNSITSGTDTTRRQGLHTGLIAPAWPTQHFLTYLLELSVGHPQVKVTKNRLRQPEAHTYHLRPEMSNLHAWKVSSNESKQEVKGSVSTNQNTKKDPLWKSMKESGKASMLGVKNGAKIVRNRCGDHVEIPRLVRE